MSPILQQVMGWRTTGGKTSSELTVVKFYDVIWRQIYHSELTGIHCFQTVTFKIKIYRFPGSDWFDVISTYSSLYGLNKHAFDSTGVFCRKLEVGSI